MTATPAVGEIVTVPWGVGTVRGKVVEVYGLPGRRQVIVELAPELSGHVVDEPTTVAFPLAAVELADVPA